jgi:hypothetical protein
MPQMPQMTDEADEQTESDTGGISLEHENCQLKHLITLVESSVKVTFQRSACFGVRMCVCVSDPLLYKSISPPFTPISYVVRRASYALGGAATVPT